MKHATAETLNSLADLLSDLRFRSLLVEKRPGVFYLKSRAFLHFHDDPAGLFADVRLKDDFERLTVTSKSQQATLLTRIDRRLSVLAKPAKVSARRHR